MLALATIASAISPLELIGDYTWTSPGRTYFSSASALVASNRSLSAVVGAAMARGALRRRNKGGEKAAAPATAKSPAAGTSDERNPLCA